MPSHAVEALGESDAFVAFNEAVSRVAKVERPVLIVGERGTGKELAARRLHFLSNRWDGPLVALNCASLPESLIEDELFGHEAGAFTGAVGPRAGRFEAADRGTCFLDEIGNIPVETQEKILRVVEYGTFERLGSSEAIQVDVRIVAATNANLVELVTAGRFKADLLDRLSFEVLHVPPLRERHSDVVLLSNHFAVRMAHELGRRQLPEFAGRALTKLTSYEWPGNIRELKNVVERAVYRSDGPRIGPDAIDFDPFRQDTAGVEERAAVKAPDLGAATVAAEAAQSPLPAALMTRPLKEALRELERVRLRRALQQNRYNQRRSAAALGLSYDQFRGIYRKHRSSLDPAG